MSVIAAYTYAWWLTGDHAAAARALRDTPPEPLEATLRAVRATAIDERTMCPASELALLHDFQGLPLDSAASIVVVDPADATVELAHGRLEALSEAVEGIVHPERLGGLAVGNPADIAHARQCEDCGRVRDRLAQGRRELAGLPAIQPPDGAAEPGEATHTTRRTVAVAAGVAAAALAVIAVWVGSIAA